MRGTLCGDCSSAIWKYPILTGNPPENRRIYPFLVVLSFFETTRCFIYTSIPIPELCTFCPVVGLLVRTPPEPAVTPCFLCFACVYCWGYFKNFATTAVLCPSIFAAAVLCFPPLLLFRVRCLLLFCFSRYCVFAVFICVTYRQRMPFFAVWAVASPLDLFFVFVFFYPRTCPCMF